MQLPLRHEIEKAVAETLSDRYGMWPDLKEKVRSFLTDEELRMLGQIVALSLNDNPRIKVSLKRKV